MPRDAFVKVHKAVTKGTGEIATAARALVPEEYGDLRDSIKTDILNSPGGRGVMGIVRAGYAPDDPRTHDALGARQQEFGRAASPGHPGHDAQPFMFPAYRLLKRRATNRIGRALREASKHAR